MIVIGGATRITRSGLAMVDWRPAGGLPPIGDAEWDEVVSDIRANDGHTNVVVVRKEEGRS